MPISDNNWSEVRQSIIDEVSLIRKSVLKNGADDIVERLVRKGMRRSNIKISKDNSRISSSLDNENEFQEGKIYFSEVFEEISQSNWLESVT